MIHFLAKNQNWAKAAPFLGLLSSVWLLTQFPLSSTLFWALVNIPLYLFHQTEEHFWPGGFKQYINKYVNKDIEGQETLTDEKIFWINILLVWLAFLIFGLLTLQWLGFGVVIILFSLINCATHFRQAFLDRRWNPGLVMASLQFAITLYAAWFLSTKGLENALGWWICGIVFSVLVHVLLFKMVMTKKAVKAN